MRAVNALREERTAWQNPRRVVAHAMVVRDHFETFRAQAAHLRDGQGLPRFVEQEFRDFLTCGCLAAGFARFRCPDCRLDRLVRIESVLTQLVDRCGAIRGTITCPMIAALHAH